MTTLPTLAVTGSTGTLGRLVAALLAADGVPQRLLARTPTRAPLLDGVMAVPCSYSDRDAARRALEGVRVLFMVSATEAPDRVQEHRTFIDAAADAGVQHIVYTSFFGAAADCTFTFGRDHFATEEHIKRSGLTYSFLRDNLYLARADIARVAATILISPDHHRNTTYNLTGPQALSMVEVARPVQTWAARVRPPPSLRSSG